MAQCGRALKTGPHHNIRGGNHGNVRKWWKLSRNRPIPRGLQLFAAPPAEQSFLKFIIGVQVAGISCNFVDRFYNRDRSNPASGEFQRASWHLPVARKAPPSEVTIGPHGPPPKMPCEH
jgi:hypothetical protein